MKKCQGKRVSFAYLLVSVLATSPVLVLAGDQDGTGQSTEETQQILQTADHHSQSPGVSPVRRIDRGPKPGRHGEKGEQELRSFDGVGNNLVDTDMGAAHVQLKRRIEPDYGDGISSLAGADRMNPREISNIVHSQSESITNPLNASDYLWQWGQFLDHDIDLTDGTDPTEAINIQIPAGDTFFDPASTGSVEMNVNRSFYDKETGTDLNNPRQQVNEITAWIDGSNVYGSDEDRALALRTLDGSGKLKTSSGDLLPFNTAGLANAGGPSDTLFLAGDVRANEQVGLLAMHTLFVREHNWWAEKISRDHSGLDGDEIYWRARRMVEAELQAITYREYLPLLLGHGSIPPYSGYDANADGRIMNLFAHGAYRYGHTALSGQILRVDANGAESEFGHLPLRNAFFSPSRLTTEGGIDPILRGLAAQVHQDIDVFVVDDVRNFLFGPPGAGGFDLASLNIQRGRDHGLPSYNDVRVAYGFSAVTDFSHISSDAEVTSRLSLAYDSVDDIDFWVGGLAEPAIAGGLVGETMRAVLMEQFTALRDADRFWYQNVLSRSDIDKVETTRLADVIRRNTDIGSEISDNVFVVGSGSNANQGQSSDDVEVILVTSQNTEDTGITIGDAQDVAASAGAFDFWTIMFFLLMTVAFLVNAKLLHDEYKE